jgi:chemotaxis methyl-accepting protein methylase
VQTLDDARAFVATICRTLDPGSRYVPELLAILETSADLADLERRLGASSRGMRHAGASVFARMTLEQKLRCNLVTNETVLFRFTDGEWLVMQRQLIPRFAAGGGRILSAPCSHGEEAFSLAAECLHAGVEFRIDAVDIQDECLAEARSGRLTMGFPHAYLETPARVSDAVLSRISFARCDLLEEVPDGRWDLVLCRNFLGYFVEEVAVGCARRLAARVVDGGALFVDQFCVGKFPTLAPALVADGFARVGTHPVFVRG